MVTGRSVLYPYLQLHIEPLLLHYELLIWFLGLLSRRDVEKGSRDLMLLLLYIYHYKYNLINCWLFSSNVARSLEDGTLR